MSCDESNWIYKDDDENKVRYVLGTGLNNAIICIGVNPSTAKPGELDNTLKRVESIARFNGYDNWIMLNLYPQRATDPYEMHNKIDTNIHNSNIREIKKLLQNIENITIWPAWGNLITIRDYLFTCFIEIHDEISKNKNITYVNGGINKTKHPRHPLRIKIETPLTKNNIFNIEDYVALIKDLNKKMEAKRKSI